MGKVGGEYRYCDTNFLVAGLAIEAVTGRPFNDVVGQLVLAPARMSDSDPGVATVVSYYPDIRLTVVVLCNQDRRASAAEAQVGFAFGAPSHQ